MNSTGPAISGTDSSDATTPKASILQLIKRLAKNARQKNRKRSKSK